jgi:hypothetical protein
MFKKLKLISAFPEINKEIKYKNRERKIKIENRICLLKSTV